MKTTHLKGTHQKLTLKYTEHCAAETIRTTDLTGTYHKSQQAEDAVVDVSTITQQEEETVADVSITAADRSITRNGYFPKARRDAALVALLKACAKQKDLCKGSKIHADILRRGSLKTHHFLGSTLVNMYAK
eukprot:c24490_g16_i2 orf=1-393(-)